eukprot:4572930-Amphidinium_carterae.1
MAAGIPPTRSRSRTHSEHAPSATSTIDYGQGHHSVASTREYRSDESHASAHQPVPDDPAEENDNDDNDDEEDTIQLPLQPNADDDDPAAPGAAAAASSSTSPVEEYLRQSSSGSASAAKEPDSKILAARR